MKHLFKKVCALLIIQLLWLPTLQAQDQGFIYGKVTTVDNKTYTGQIRWGKEEAYWSDMFNSSKTHNDNLDYLSRKDMKTLRKQKRRRDFGIIRIGDHYSYEHVFACRFGDIKTLKVTGRQKVELFLKNNIRIKLKGGSNDIGATVRVMDKALGEIAIKWSRIDQVDFMPTPAKLDTKMGTALYGTVETHKGKFTGLIQWDHDERLGSDILNGKSEDGRMKIPFKNITTIKKHRWGSLVVLKSGSEVYLTGTNDVEDGNRGIIVSHPLFGRIDIDWEDFKKVSFVAKANSGKGYNDYKAPTMLKGTVTTTDNRTVTGSIIYDLDEKLSIEMLDGKVANLSHQIPFGIIKSITPKNRASSEVELKSGQKIVLGESQDVSERHTGIIVLMGKENKEYIPWDKVSKVSFE
jgi:sporulation protein YlmC with PRC-barrel domain